MIIKKPENVSGAFGDENGRGNQAMNREIGRETLK